MCPVMTFNLYLSKLDKTMDLLWQRPKQGRVHYTDETWYEPRRVGEDLLNRFMKFLQISVKLEGTYTNHSIRATVISTLDYAGFEARHIMTLSSHKNESTIKEYSVKCPENKQKEMFSSLTNAMQPRFKKIKPKSTAPATVSIPDNDAKTDVKTDGNKENSLQEVPNIKDIKDNLPNFQLQPMEDFETIDDNILRDLLNDDFNDVTANNAVTVPPQNTQIATPTINNQVNTINMPSQNLPKLPIMYFPHSNVTINYNIQK